MNLEQLIPGEHDYLFYNGSTTDFLIVVRDNGTPVPLADYDDIRWKIFLPSKYDEPFLELSVTNGRMTIINENELTGTYTAEETHQMASETFNSELWFDIGGKPYAFVTGRALTKKAPYGNVGSIDSIIDINPVTHQVTITGITSVGAAVQAAEDAKEYRDETIVFHDETQFLRNETEVFRDETEADLIEVQQIVDDAETTFTGKLSVLHIDPNGEWIEFVALDPATVTEEIETITGVNGQPLDIEIIDIQNITQV